MCNAQDTAWVDKTVSQQDSLAQLEHLCHSGTLATLSDVAGQDSGPGKRGGQDRC